MKTIKLILILLILAQGVWINAQYYFILSDEEIIGEKSIKILNAIPHTVVMKGEPLVAGSDTLEFIKNSCVTWFYFKFPESKIMIRYHVYEDEESGQLIAEWGFYHQGHCEAFEKLGKEVFLSKLKRLIK